VTLKSSKPSRPQRARDKEPAASADDATRAAAAAAAPARARTARKVRTRIREAKFALGQVVRHRFYPFRGVIFDIDPVFNNTEEWWQSIPEEIRPRKNQPFYHLLAENADTEYIAYVSEQNLLADDSGTPLRHPKVTEMFAEDEHGQLTATFLEHH
jgi:heat shock protein HspQ